jgi:hypothetical protein
VFVAAEGQFIEKVEAGEMTVDEFKEVLQTHHQLLVANAISKHSLLNSQQPPDADPSRLSLSSSLVLVPQDMSGEGGFAEAVRRLSLLASESTPSDTPESISSLSENNKLADSAVQAANNAWDSQPQLRGPLTDLVCTGAIPKKHYHATWCRLTGAERARTGGMSLQQLLDIAEGRSPSNGFAINLDAHTKHRIRKDLHRTCCNDEFSIVLDQTEDGELYQILAAYASIDTNVGYVQGMNYIAAMCLSAMRHAQTTYTPDNDQVDPMLKITKPKDVEDIAGKKKKIAIPNVEASFLLFVRLMQGTGLRRLYDSKDAHLHELILRLDWHIRGCLPKLHAHLEAEGVGATLFAVEWLTTLFVYNVTYDNAAIIFSLLMVCFPYIVSTTFSFSLITYISLFSPE